MALVKQLTSTSLVLEVQAGTDKTGAPVFRKKSFAGIKSGSDIQKISDVAEAIKGVLGAPTRSVGLAENHKIINA